ncbi:ATP-binding protein [Amycolatopsis sp. NPDC088138]|uniref:ATP-binding protein n=1 Tax=Amycolatopsis sp. NPDC088138 TaxID=3363938 RepID=UPI00382BDE12
MDLPEPATHEYRFDAGVTPDLAAVRRWIRSVLDGASSEGLEDALLLATELVANAQDHAQGVRALRIRCRGPRSAVRLEIDDARPDLAVRLGGSSSDEDRGRGLLLVDAVSRRWGVVTHDDVYKTVWADLAAS